MKKRPFEELEGKTILYFSPTLIAPKIREAIVAGYDEYVGMCIVDKKDPEKVYFVTEGPGAPVWGGKFPPYYEEDYSVSKEVSYNMLISGYFSVPKFEQEVGNEADDEGDVICPFGS